MPEAHGEYAIETRGLRKVFKIGAVAVEALRNVNLGVRHGEFVSIMGPSGSGKSTLLNMLGALDRPTAGQVLVDGVDITKLNDFQLARFRNEKIGFIFQSYNLINRSTVIRNVELPAMVKGTPEKTRKKRALELLSLVGLGGKAYRKPNALSGGEQQRVAIARSLINEPTFILGDEPTGNLDTKTGAEVTELLKRINRERQATLVIVTHNPELVQEADRIIRIRDGLIEKETMGITA